MSLSVLCLIHCLAIPLLIGFLPVLAHSFMQHEQFHVMIVGLVMPVAGLGLLPGFLRTRQKRVLYWGAAGLALITMAAFGHEVVGERGETLLTVVGALCLFRGHWLNHTRTCACPHAH
ncbi:MAG: MerC domain-containing protein [Candidatus Eremiobacterota bacterium]